jgi:hypothetical protein
MGMNDRLTIEYVREVLDYDPATGVLTWKVSSSNRVKVGSRAGVVATNGRRYVSLCGEKLMAHRVAWAHFHGVWPAGDVKQKSGNYDDCSINNLVEQTRQETATNRAVNSNSKSGHAGVTWSQRVGKWQVHITKDYKQVGLGYFDKLDEAVSARRNALESLEVSVSGADKEKAAHAISRRRRQRTAWNRLAASGCLLGWSSLDDFCKDIGDIPERRSAIVAIDALRPIGPGNFKFGIEAGHDFRTREGRIAYSRAHRKSNPDLYREKELRKSFDIGLSDFDRMLAEQNGVCAICERPERAERNGKSLALAVDHCHTTKKIRGVLCGNCNKALGKFEDNPDFLRNALVYLSKHAERVPVTINYLHADQTLGIN